MTKEEFILKNLDETFLLWTRRAVLWGSLMFFLLCGLDYIATPENFLRFLVYRALVGALLLLCYFLMPVVSRRYLYLMTFVMVAASAAAIELMILQFGGHESPYDVGMILLAISVTGFIPASFRFHVVTAVAIYLIFLLPILAYEDVLGHAGFITDNIFMLLIFVTMLFMRYLSGASLREELGLKYELERHRERLEEVVAGRTAELAGAIERLHGEMNERQRLHGQLLHAQKMESVGRLAGGVAHDFNNILTAIMSYAELSLMKLPDDHPVRGHVSGIRDASDKAAALTRQLLAFSRKQVLEMTTVDLNAVVQEMARLVSRLISEDICLEIAARADSSLVRADRGQIEQVIMNLAINAKDAMPAGGRLVMETATVSGEEAVRGTTAVAEAQRYVRLSVTDTGEGMSEEVRQRVFEPFFTTKELGKGTGLGLATVYGIVKQHHGFIFADSERGKGATFRVYLPLAMPSSLSQEGERRAAAQGGAETILVVEDDRAIRDLVREVLETLGYRVLLTGSGEEAAALCEAFQGTIHLLLADVVMPGLRGTQVAEIFRRRRPGIKVLFMSGYTDDALSLEGMLDPGTALINKPIGPAELARRVRQVLDSGR